MQKIIVMMLRAWQRGFAILLLMTTVSSVAAADRACPASAPSAESDGAQHHGTESSHHDESSHHGGGAPDGGMECHMMLTCGSAVSVQVAPLHVISIAMAAPPSMVAPHYTAPHLRQESPPPKKHA